MHLVLRGHFFEELNVVAGVESLQVAGRGQPRSKYLQPQSRCFCTTKQAQGAIVTAKLAQAALGLATTNAARGEVLTSKAAHDA